MSGWSHTWWSKLGCLWNFYLHYFPLAGRAVFIETELATEIWRQINHCPLWEICSGRHAEPSLLAAHAAVCRADNRKHWVREAFDKKKKHCGTLRKCFAPKIFGSAGCWRGAPYRPITTYYDEKAQKRLIRARPGGSDRIVTFVNFFFFFKWRLP